MKNLILLITLSFAFSFAVNVEAATSAAPRKKMDVQKQMDTLGGNEALVEKAKALDPENKSQIVQKRAVDRHSRFEVGANYGLVAGGDPYYNTQNFGGTVDFHFTPRWSIGGRYYKYQNQLTTEGKNVFDGAQARQNAGRLEFQIPSVDYPVSSAWGVINWYPIYGKLNMFDAGIIQFDIYLLAGYGKMELSSGWTDALTAGGGLGFWWSQHVSSRLEARYQTYKETVDTGGRKLDEAVITLGMGILL